MWILPEVEPKPVSAPNLFLIALLSVAWYAGKTSSYYSYTAPKQITVLSGTRFNELTSI